MDLTASGRKSERNFVLCQDWPSLLWMANFGCIELIPWGSRVSTLDWPDYLVIDLDPQDVPFDQVVEAAQAVHKLLDGIGAASYCKTSGKRGLHVYVPLGAKYLFNQARLFGELIARLVHRHRPQTTSLNPFSSQRPGLIYLDYSRNSRGQAVAAPYCARPWPGATVSAPLKWSELRRGLDPGRFTIKTMPKRLEKVGDLWGPVLGAGIDLAKCLAKLESQNHTSDEDISRREPASTPTPRPSSGRGILVACGVADRSAQLTLACMRLLIWPQQMAELRWVRRSCGRKQVRVGFQRRKVMDHREWLRERQTKPHLRPNGWHLCCLTSLRGGVGPLHIAPCSHSHFTFTSGPGKTKAFGK